MWRADAGLNAYMSIIVQGFQNLVLLPTNAPTFIVKCQEHSACTYVYTHTYTLTEPRIYFSFSIPPTTQVIYLPYTLTIEVPFFF